MANKLLSLFVLYPVSRIYGVVMSMRNMFFNKGIFKQHSFKIPVIVVGNLTMGGSGKTPHTEYLVNKLLQSHKIGVLSRGYKRKTHGFVQATPNSHVDDIGDEPYQIYRKFSKRGAMIAVCEDRVKGINKMLEINPELDLIILDDAFQHRYVKPDLAIVLLEYNRLPYEDSLLPYGRLREPMRALNRADVVVVTKCPENMKPMERRIIEERLNLFPYQKLLFSCYRYLPPVPIFTEFNGKTTPQLSLGELTERDTILCVSGVANPRPFIRYLRKFKAKVKIKRYADHHHFSHADMESIYHKFKTMEGDRKVMITTEKDAVRLMSNPYFPSQMCNCSYYLPIEVDFDTFNDSGLEDVVNQHFRSRIR